MTNQTGDWPFATLGIHVLWLGDPGPAAARLADQVPALRLTIRPALSHDDVDEIVAAAGRRVPAPFDLLVLDATSSDIPAPRVLQAVRRHDVDLPVVLLVREWHAQVDAEARELGHCEYVIKTDGYLQQLLPVFARALSGAALARAHRACQEREARLTSAVEEVTARFARLAEGCEAAVMIYRAGHLTFANSVLEGLTGYTRDELYSRDLMTLMTPESRAILASGEGAGQEAATRATLALLTRTGRMTDLAATLISVPDEGCTAVLAVGRPAAGAHPALARERISPREDDEGGDDAVTRSRVLEQALAEAVARCQQLAAERASERERLEAERRQVEMHSRRLAEQSGAERSDLEPQWTAEAARYRELLAEGQAERARLLDAIRQAELRYAGYQDEVHRQLTELAGAFGRMERQIRSVGDRLVAKRGPEARQEDQ